MKFRLAPLPLVSLFLLVAGCAARAPEPVRITVPARPIDYLNEVKPILDKRCTVCHSCYNSPCQLKLDSYEGLDRGATKRAIYNATRLQSMDPTRLFIDADSTAGWRRKQFFSVTESTAKDGFNDSIMLQLLSHKMKTGTSFGDFHPETEDLTCAENGKELGGYLKKHPNRGMPFGFPPLKQEEFELIAGWLGQGAKGPTREQQEDLERPKPADAAAIAQWEAFLNEDDAKHAMTARYLYEHLFLAHIRFGTGTNEFYEMVRSRTAPGEPIDLIASVRPYDDPGRDYFYYRFRKIHSTIVHKTHMVFDLDSAMMARINELFIRPEWLQPPHPMGYHRKHSANPFWVYEQIPPRARYQFLLDNALYIIMTFIHGPVCKGQVALNVIDDHFWVMFLDPEHDLSVLNPAFLKLHREDLRMPIEQGSDLRLFSVISDAYREGAQEFYRSRQDLYTTMHYNGMGYDAVWKGSKAADAPLLTVYRHFDSASVHKGALGSLPKTMWVIDYPLLERIYYALVAGFDVYGTAKHQLAIRLYMDSLRVEGESYFLDFMPEADRRKIMQSWYRKVDLKKINYYPSSMPSGIAFITDDPKREFVETIVKKHLLPETKIAFDRVNYQAAGADYPPIPEKYVSDEDFLQGFRAISRPGTAFVSLVSDNNANLAYVRVRREKGKDVAFTMIGNRWHNNVAFLFGEDGALDPKKDDADFVMGLIGSYPNYFFDVHERDLPDFIDLLAHYDDSPAHIARLARYGVNRADARFWDTYDWFQERHQEDDPVRAGLFDLNRYYYKARENPNEAKQ